ARTGGCVSVRRRDDHPAVHPGVGPAHRLPLAVPVLAAVLGHHRGAGGDLAQSEYHTPQLARVARQTLPPRTLTHRFPATGRTTNQEKLMTDRRQFMLSAGATALATALPGSLFAQEAARIGFVYVSPIGDAGWTYQHDLARKEM